MKSITKRLLHNVSYLFYSERNSWSCSIRIKRIMITVGRNRVSGRWQIWAKQIYDLDILGLYHEVGGITVKSR